MLWWCGNALAAFLDFSAGTLVVCVAGTLFQQHISILTYILGGLLALVPDFDVLFAITKGGVVEGNHHENLTHRPLVIILLTAMVVLISGGIFWALTATACLLWHLLHDTEGFGGGGIAWFWPVSQKYYSPIRPPVEPQHSRSGKLVGTHREWINKTWLKLSPTSFIEISVGSILISSSGAMLFNHFAAALILFSATWAAVVTIWAFQLKKEQAAQ